MSTALTTPGIDPAVIERVLLQGDLKALTPAQKLSYYKAVCESVGLNPLTKPFHYLTLNGKEILYAGRDATDQLRQVRGVSVDITAREVVEDCYVVTARAQLADGRHDESIGAVPMRGLGGEARANAMMKAETKAKRRVTLAICGLGMLDETEVGSLPDAQPLEDNGDLAVTEEPRRSPPAMTLDYGTARPLITTAQRKKLFAMATAKGWDVERFKTWLHSRGISSTSTIAQADFDAVLKMVESYEPPQPDEPAR